MYLFLDSQECQTLLVRRHRVKMNGEEAAARLASRQCASRGLPDLSDLTFPMFCLHATKNDTAKTSCFVNQLEATFRT
ncbi:MAG: hypothetical protein DMG96_20405 [Acidobacteria bacterium]|nr:MAG: hypothetical protein DMG98_25870 [Acidobacteriota bacterium]PYV74395.1 MAG: hypothetical protein DMG96_20405 [Acidobacteriota bacterium]